MKYASTLVLLLIFTAATVRAQNCTTHIADHLAIDLVATLGKAQSFAQPVACIADSPFSDGHRIYADDPLYSTTEEIWTGFSWQNNSKTEYEYSEAGQLTRQVLLRWNTGAQDFINQTSTDYLYDESTNTSENIRAGWNGTAFENQERNVFQSDAFGNQIRIERFNWENGTWQTRFLSVSVVENGLITETIIQTTHAQGTLENSKRRTFTYDAEGREVVEEEEAWDDTSQSWMLDTRELTVYDGTNVVTTTQEYTAGNWIDTFETVAVYANDLLMEHATVSLTGTSSGNRFLYTYDSTGHLAEFVAQEPDGTGGWQSYFRNAFTLDADGDPLELLIQSFNQDNTMWDNILRISYNYQSDPAATAIEDEMIPGLTSFDVYPYPATDRVNVALQLSQANAVRLEVFDTLGRRVFDLSNDVVLSGTQQIAWSPRNEPAGLYFIRLSVDGAVATKPIALIK